MSRAVVQMTIDDAEHYTPEQRAAIIAGYPAHEREARTKGIPILGSGRVFPVAEEVYTCEPITIPRHWPQINGLDFGWDHPFAAVNMAWDRDADCVYLCKEFAARESTPVVQSAAIKPWGPWIPCAWPADGMQHEKGSGKSLAPQYTAQGLNMLAEHATFEDGGVSVEAGIADIIDRMQTGRWKVFNTLVDWIGEARLYHREKGVIVKLKDDRISASRYGLMMLRHAALPPASTAAPKRGLKGF